MTGRRGPDLRNWLRTMAIGACSLLPSTPLMAQTQSRDAGGSSYRYVVPSGWTRSVDGASEILAPITEPAGTVQIILLAPKPARGDFTTQFTAERTSLEHAWGLRAPRAAPIQQGQSTTGSYGAYFASYESDAGDRYLGFVVLTQSEQLAILVIAASTSEVFNRFAPIGVDVFKALKIAAH